MKADYALEEIKNLIKKGERNNRVKTLVVIAAGMAVVVGVIIVVMYKLKGKDTYEYDDWSELDDMDYDDYDDFDEYEYEEEDFDEAESEDAEGSVEI